MINPIVPGMMNPVVVGMSGGVDSAVAALLLHREGIPVVGVFMKNWDEQDADGHCAADQDWSDVRAVCDHIGIPYYNVNFTKQYWDNVFTLCLDEFRKGRTPNPDVLCNREIKFKVFLEYSLKVGGGGIATGHFCQTNEAGELLRGFDPLKDQSYFLYMLKREQLKRTLFPVGGLTKARVREIARENGLPVADKRDSTGICFIGERRFKEFLQKYLPAQPGSMRDRATGEKVGRHDGLMYYTLGQRRGLGIGGGKTGGEGRWFVMSKELDTNTLWVMQGLDTPELHSRQARCVETSWINSNPPSGEFRCAAKFRYRQDDQAVRVVITADGLIVESDEPQRALTPGQSVVFYDGELCLGGAIIDTVI
ncbi:tRNA-specific 2-thiouridylase MnmA [Clostridia bacterium]|nr:tRNA-specific 2-thiouridylase MnmA [Clostridia bacterium]